MVRPHVLFIDAYDSFSNNIISLLEDRLYVNVTKIQIDREIPDISDFLSCYAAIIIGPGPGNPCRAEDIGSIRNIWDLQDRDIIPILGICLGFQSLVVAFGGSVRELPRPRHGQVTRVTTCSESIFRGLPEIEAVQYHSLHAVLPSEESYFGEVEDSVGYLDRRKGLSVLIPLAWDFEEQARKDLEDYRTNPAAILMAARHSTKPFFGIQFHPESICSGSSAHQVVENWWSDAQEWLKAHRPGRLFPNTVSTEPPASLSLPCSRHFSQSSTPAASPQPSPSPASTPISSRSSSPEPQMLMSGLQSIRIPLGRLDVPHIVELLNVHKDELIILDSEKRQMPGLGRYSIIGLIGPSTIKISYSVGSDCVHVDSSGDKSLELLSSYDKSIFNYLKAFMSNRRLPAASVLPFHGGLMGYITYEACLETIGSRVGIPSRNPDLCFAFVERSIVIDHLQEHLYVQSIAPVDQKWVENVSSLLRNATSRAIEQYIPNLQPKILAELPSHPRYIEKIATCKRQIRAGNSYELCLTSQATASIVSKDAISPWNRYQTLRRRNPAPFAAYVRLGSLTLLSSSPERFMCWSRPVVGGSRQSEFTCQFRPIKGTVQKRQQGMDGTVREVNLQEATTQLSTIKERAENLMIVDLIRHDLHGAVGSGNVRVKSLMAVEEYETVFQLVSVIEGSMPTSISPEPHLESSSIGKTGIDVLAASLPPGSMTGAPKKRACQLLQEIEEQEPRSVYSGVLGYMCVGGGGDFSVLIRSAYKWDSDGEITHEEWRIGAGGAITDLSSEQSEWEEMMAKMAATMRAFDM